MKKYFCIIWNTNSLLCSKYTTFSYVMVNVSTCCPSARHEDMCGNGSTALSIDNFNMRWEWAVSFSLRLGKEILYHLIRGCVCPRANMVILEKRKYLVSAWHRTTIPRSSKPYSSHHTEYAILAHWPYHDVEEYASHCRNFTFQINLPPFI
jgi:hypothetical protein